jgi:hypothetical protein
MHTDPCVGDDPHRPRESTYCEGAVATIENAVTQAHGEVEEP